MDRTPPIRISRAGAQGRAEFEAFRTHVTVLTSRPAVTATAALAVRRGLSSIDVSSGGARSRAADRLAAKAARAAGGGVLVSLGGDLSTAGPAPAPGWRVRLDDGLSPEPEALLLVSGGVATVRSASPCSSWRGVTVAAPSCRVARMTAVAAAQRGEGAQEWLSAMGTAARLVSRRGAVGYTGWWSSRPVAA